MPLTPSTRSQKSRLSDLGLCSQDLVAGVSGIGLPTPWALHVTHCLYGCVHDCVHGCVHCCLAAIGFAAAVELEVLAADTPELDELMHELKPAGLSVGNRPKVRLLVGTEGASAS